jgi:hypothetical protein
MKTRRIQPSYGTASAPAGNRAISKHCMPMGRGRCAMDGAKPTALDGAPSCWDVWLFWSCDWSAAHISSPAWFYCSGLSTCRSTASFVGFGISYAILLALLYRISTARSRRARLFYALTHWLYWLCMLPAFLNAVKRMALGQVDWLKSPHVPFIKMITKRAVLERVKGIEPSS